MARLISVGSIASVALGHLGIALVLRIGERLQELPIPRRTADVLRRAAADSLKEPRLGGSRIAGLDALYCL